MRRACRRHSAVAASCEAMTDADTWWTTGSKRRERHHVGCLRRRAGNVTQIGKWIVPLQISSGVRSGVTHGRNTFNVCFPCFSCPGECADYVVVANRPGKAVVKGLKVSG